MIVLNRNCVVKYERCDKKYFDHPMSAFSISGIVEGELESRENIMGYKVVNFVPKIKKMYFLLYLNTLKHQYDNIVWLSVVLQVIRIMMEIVCRRRRIIINIIPYKTLL